MNRSGPRLIAVLLLATLVAMNPPSPEPRHGAMPGEARRLPPMSTGTEDDADARDEIEFLIVRDPRTNSIPRDIRDRELRFARALPARRAGVFRLGAAATAIQPLVWTERGPNNVGGRTRAFAVDVANPTRLLAGSVAGGIWVSANDGASWSLHSSPGQIHSITCIAQDKRAGRTNTWYAGTGEIRGSTTNATRWGSLYLGDGIFKSVNGGLSWSLLPASATGTPQTTDPFDYINSIATNPANAGQDEVLAATYRGIYRSADGGGSWAQVIASDSGYTDVAITSTGAMYAVTRTGSLIRVWRSVNGTSWNIITPASFPTAANRIVMGLAPSNPAVVYFFAQGVNAASVGGHQFWKYTYVSGDGSGGGGTWLNRTANLPPDIFTQTGYDQVCHVKPDDENFVLIGGTDLYRSTNGFASTAATTLIGGYPFFPDLNHHPDLQSGAFSSADPKVYYSSNDGGVQKAADVTLPSMVWTWLNHGYNVTQFYSVAIPPDAGSNLMLAGAQDNGSRLGNAPGASDWSMPFGGDGTIVEVSSAAQNRLYTQWQGGNMQRMQWDGSNVVEITPDAAINRLFVNPIVLDPNNPALLYYAGGSPDAVSGIWRNNNAPLADTLTGWVSLLGTDVGDGVGYQRRISALGISTSNSANVLYYGTTDGVVKRAVNANTAAPTVSYVPPPGLGAGTAQGGFVRCIAVDPTNSDRALVAFGNYNFPSLWYTTNGGANWTDVEGNLAGPSGPSIRWATMFDLDGQIVVFLGTSIGVLSTSALTGGSTVWTQEAAAEIGNVLIAYMDFRPSDRTLAVATHGRGVFTTRFLPVNDVGENRPARVRLGQSYPNPTEGATSITFELPRATDASLRLYDVSGREVAVLAEGPRASGRHVVPLAADRLAPGAYYYVLKALGTAEKRRLVVRR